MEKQFKRRLDVSFKAIGFVYIFMLTVLTVLGYFHIVLNYDMEDYDIEWIDIIKLYFSTTLGVFIPLVVIYVLTLTSITGLKRKVVLSEIYLYCLVFSFLVPIYTFGLIGYEERTFSSIMNNQFHIPITLVNGLLSMKFLEDKLKTKVKDNKTE